MIHWTHRLLAFGFAALVIVLAWRVWRERGRGAGGGALARAVAGVVLLTAIQFVVAAAMVLNLLPPSLRAVHLLTGTAIWAALVMLVFVSSRTAAPAGALEVTGPSQMKDYLTLTKPRIISLLLVTTIAPMFITDRGMPSAGAGILGGARRLPDGGRRQRHQHVVRPRHRHADVAHPAPAHPARPHLAARRGCAFGVALGALAFAIFWCLVNPLSACAGAGRAPVLRLHLHGGSSGPRRRTS